MTFIGDLYRRFHGIVLSKPTNFSWVIDRELAASARPSDKGTISWLKREGVKSILTLTENPIPQEWLESEKMTVHHISIRDHSLPTAAQMKEAVDYIEQNLKDGRSVLVHCAAGVGRTGVMLGAYMMKKFNLTPEDAILRVRESRPGSIEVQQEDALSKFKF